MIKISLFALVLLGTSTVLANPPQPAKVSSELAYVLHILDGDTIQVRLVLSGKEQKVRLWGIDCTETQHNKRCMNAYLQGRPLCDKPVSVGLRAEQQTEEKLLNKRIVLECIGPCQDGNMGRALRYVRQADGSDFGLWLVENGYCEDNSKSFPHPRQEIYRQAQDRAKKAKKGLWTFPQPPKKKSPSQTLNP